MWAHPVDVDAALDELATRDAKPSPGPCPRPLRDVANLPKGSRVSWFPYPDRASSSGTIGGLHSRRLGHWRIERRRHRFFLPVVAKRLYPPPPPPTGRCRASELLRSPYLVPIDAPRDAELLCLARAIAGEPVALCPACAPGLDRLAKRKGALF